MDNINLNQSGIYAITSPSGKRYVGSAVNIRKRWQAHRKHLRAGTHHCKALQRAYHKYHGDFVWSVLVLCPKEELIREEQQQMDWAAPGTLYNSNPKAGSALGIKRSDETRAKIRRAKLGKPHSEETRAKLR
ncbi:GIY-YIG nuclease family protein, partial [Xanthomonas citri pv. citri]|nr:GIY-YIG nuclease family protein [Xanthomonas citri pv. citri]